MSVRQDFVSANAHTESAAPIVRTHIQKRRGGRAGWALGEAHLLSPAAAFALPGLAGLAAAGGCPGERQLFVSAIAHTIAGTKNAPEGVFLYSWSFSMALPLILRPSAV